MKTKLIALSNKYCGITMVIMMILKAWFMVLQRSYSTSLARVQKGHGITNFILSKNVVFSWYFIIFVFNLFIYCQCI